MTLCGERKEQRFIIIMIKIYANWKVERNSNYYKCKYNYNCIYRVPMPSTYYLTIVLLRLARLGKCSVDGMAN